jgi:hypothetical protein
MLQSQDLCSGLANDAIQTMIDYKARKDNEREAYEELVSKLTNSSYATRSSSFLITGRALYLSAKGKPFVEAQLWS